MKIIFLTNILTPHQLPLSQTFNNMPNVEYELIECVDLDRSELPIGWRQGGEFDFVVSYERLSENLYYYIEKIAKADVVITGSAPDFLIKKRLKEKRLTFRYSERVYKKKCPWYEVPFRAIKYYFQFSRYKNLYLLCASAYTAGDYAKTATFLNKTFKWGYFPKTQEYDIDYLISQKAPNSMLWAARYIDWKHPEMPVEIARRLKEDGFDFTLNLIGEGELQDQIQKLIDELGLQDRVKILGSMPPEEVRAHMEKSEIFLMTSDRQEGWGAVLNEAMNSCCAAVANCQAGSAPFLIKDAENGFLYDTVDCLYDKVKLLLTDSKARKDISKKAYLTIYEQWNAQNAADRLVELAKELLSGEAGKDLFEDGVCSCAKSIKDNWYNCEKGK